VNSLLKKIGMTLAVIIILAAVFSSLFRSLTPWAKQYKGEVEHHLSVLLGQSVTIQSMETGWYWFEPVLKLKKVTLSDHNQKILQIERLQVGINLFKSLWHWRIQPGVLSIDDVNFVFRQQKDHWTIDGIVANAMNNSEMTPKKGQEILVWLAQQEKLIIRHASAYIYFNDGVLIPVGFLNVAVVNQGDNYKLKAEAKLEQTNSTSFQLLGDVSFDPYQLDQTKGRLYFSAKQIVPAQWQSLLPKMPERIEGGKGDIALWLDLDKGKISAVQAQVKLKRLAWSLLNKKDTQLIQSLYANLEWRPDNKGCNFMVITLN